MVYISKFRFGFILFVLSMIIGFIEDTHAYVIKSNGSGFSMNDIIELSSYGVLAGITLFIIGVILKSKGIKDFSIQIIVLAISPILFIGVSMLFGFIISLF